MNRKNILTGLAAIGLIMMMGVPQLMAENIGDPDVSVTEDLTVGRRLGVGTSFPSEIVDIRSNLNPGLRIQETDTGATGYLKMYNNESPTVSQGVFDVNSFSGEALIDYNPKAYDGTSRAYFRLFRSTNTTGPKSMMVFRGNGTTELSAQIGADGRATFFGMQNGKVGIGTKLPATKLDVNGEITCTVVNITGGSDLSERFDITSLGKAPVLPGMVVSIDAKNPGDLLVSRNPYDRTVAGVISGAAGLNPGMVMSQPGTNANGKYPVALTGRVYCFCDASYGPITPGDMLTTSKTPGHAMKVTDYQNAHGATIGKAMTSLENGKGLVLILVSLQ